MKKILTKRERTILYITAAVIGFSIAFNFLLAPVLTKYSELNREINLTRSRFKKYLRLLSQKEALEKRYNQFASSVRLPEQKEDALVAVLAELEALAKNANIRILDIRPQLPATAATRKETNVEVKAEGNLNDYMKFIYGVEQSFLCLAIKKFQFASKPNSQLLDASFTIRQLSATD